MTPSRCAAVSARRSPIAPMLDIAIFPAAATSSCPEKLVAANAERAPIPSACASSASMRVVGSPHAWLQTMRSPGCRNSRRRRSPGSSVRVIGVLPEQMLSTDLRFGRKLHDGDPRGRQLAAMRLRLLGDLDEMLALLDEFAGDDAVDENHVAVGIVAPDLTFARSQEAVVA